MEDPPAGGGGGGGGGSGGGVAVAEGPVVQVADIRWPKGALPIRLLEWKVKPGSHVNLDSVLALCAPIPQEKGAEAATRLPERKVKSDRAGVVKELCCQLGQVIPPGLQDKNGNQQIPISTATVSMVHSVPELMVSSEQAEQLGREDQQRLHRNKKLVLMVDLDQTLIHTTEQHCQRMSNKGIFHFQLGRGEPMLHTRLRPHCKAFLEKIAKLFELHVFTFGSRLYAHTIAGFLDPEKKLFSHRILSRDECIDPFSKTGNLRNLFPCGDAMVSIIDDREDVWKFAPNLITVKKYIYFQGTGDINAPPGSREAQMAKKAGGPSSRPAAGTEPSGTSNADEPNNGPKKRAKDLGLSRKEESATTLVAPKAPDSAANNLDFDLSSDSDNDSTKEKPRVPESVGEAESTTESRREGAAAGDGKGETVSDAAEPSGVLPTDPELDNGRSDRRETETESQNSEQSGVTMGEELLDQSMEEEEEEEDEDDEADVDQDDHLIYLEEVLERIHAEYYARYETYLKKEAPETPDIRKIAPELKGKTLAGTTVVFSGLYPTNYPMERTREYYHAKALGAKIGKTLVFNAEDACRTTHLIAARAGTEKVRQAQGCKHLHVVNPDWLWSCLERWERVEEQLYPLKEDCSKMPRSNSPAAFPDLHGSLQTHVYQPAPVHHRPLPQAPEVRTYDPVTGNLIRRGPQPPRPPSYLQGAGSGEQSCLSGPSKCQQDDEQPGPSRRSRQQSMSETMPLYTLCKEDLDSMDREVDDMLDEESENEGEGRAKEKPGNGAGRIAEEEEEEEEEEEAAAASSSSAPGGELGPQAVNAEETMQTASGEAGVTRGHKRKHDEAREEEDDNKEEEEEEAREDSADESSKDSNEDGGGSSSEADEMAAALDLELNDFM
ncbi:RNA polymerase II subunit A C-terminal domain phosphatase [Liparis tanakae]|uniref:RNA polymerase II subunit A C-terminal domain phosphatase n=1 Tax=Liparis tanakae TaxID=230148 RepID=A0A4Z2GDA8_9TELE|nr:RNA polymerase II subunit A C-terminal domain phosphatase [Liparis tanakae]